MKTGDFVEITEECPGEYSPYYKKGEIGRLVSKDRWCGRVRWRVQFLTEECLKERKDNRCCVLQERLSKLSVEPTELRGAREGELLVALDEDNPFYEREDAFKYSSKHGLFQQFIYQTKKTQDGIWKPGKVGRLVNVGTKTFEQQDIRNKAAAKEYAVATQWPNKKPLHTGWFGTGLEARAVHWVPKQETRFDPYTMKAAEIFDVKPSDVSRRQREYAKQENYGGKI